MTEEQKAIINNEQQSPEPEISQPVQEPSETVDEQPQPEDTGLETTIPADAVSEQQPEPVLRSPDAVYRDEGGTTDLPPGVEPTVESVVEAVLFASDESLSAARLAEIAGTTVKQLRKHIDDLNAKYKANNNAFQIEQIAGGYQMLTLSIYSHWLKKLIRARDDSKLSQPALETLAIISYKQPIIRADIEAIRGVAAGEMIRNLMYKRLVKITGRAEVLGRPLLYGTTKKFLEVFGLNSLKDLPKAEELKKPE
jgi:segregation and condensation protein B